MFEYKEEPIEATCEMCKQAIPKNMPFLFLAAFEHTFPHYAISPRTLCLHCFDTKVSKEDILKLMTKNFNLAKSLNKHCIEQIKKILTNQTSLSESLTKTGVIK